MAFDDWKEFRKENTNYKHVIDKLVQDIGDVYGYVYHFHDSYDKDDVQQLTYRCSQRSETRKKVRKVDDPKKQRNRKGSEKFPCQGKICVTYNYRREGSGSVTTKVGSSSIELERYSMVVNFRYECMLA